MQLHAHAEANALSAGKRSERLRLGHGLPPPVHLDQAEPFHRQVQRLRPSQDPHEHGRARVFPRRGWFACVAVRARGICGAPGEVRAEDGHSGQLGEFRGREEGEERVGRGLGGGRETGEAAVGHWVVAVGAERKRTAFWGGEEGGEQAKGRARGFGNEELPWSTRGGGAVGQLEKLGHLLPTVAGPEGKQKQGLLREPKQILRRCPARAHHASRLEGRRSGQEFEAEELEGQRRLPKERLDDLREFRGRPGAGESRHESLWDGRVRNQVVNLAVVRPQHLEELALARTRAPLALFRVRVLEERPFQRLRGGHVRDVQVGFTFELPGLLEESPCRAAALGGIQQEAHRPPALLASERGGLNQLVGEVRSVRTGQGAKLV
mmetsp:Transcript_13752/g.32591  ORF Transcript_13752/g.32591 Transcript_13752/m.32591 type:complete len:379 (+) Transcript_13752:487-1623(+)